jgi:hypothetical protein
MFREKLRVAPAMNEIMKDRGKPARSNHHERARPGNSTKGGCRGIDLVVSCWVRIPQDPGGAGKFQANYLAGLLQGYRVSTEREEGSKENRADPFAAQCEHGFVTLVEGPWNAAFVEELCAFPHGAHARARPLLVV